MRVLRGIVIVIATLLAGTAARADSVVVTHWGSAYYGAPYAVAMAKGFFKQNGVDITGITSGAGGGTSVRNTLAGDLPFGEVALSATVQAIQHGEPLVMVCGGTDTVGDILWIAKKGSSLHAFADLKGKRVGFTAPGSVTNMVLLMALQKHGWDRSAFQMMPAGDIGANLSAVLSGAVDTAMTGEPVWSENEDKLQPVFWAKDEAGDRITQNVCITTRDFAASKEGAAKLRALLAARREGVRYVYAHPDEAADITAKAYNGDPVLYRKVFQHMIAMHYWEEGTFDYQGMNRMMDGLRILGQIKGDVDWSKMVDTNFLPPDLKPHM
ncbi:MAG TPA: ABC transporter substrate-binding protein [Acetobacteraceae bacterium]|jgi:NitT/TauT family transport system substrate-binding protein|nr:ABC transporter substrate-binding protein [Acetobacteraceae bacterium]